MMSTFGRTIFRKNKGRQFPADLKCYDLNSIVTGFSPTSILTETASAPQKLLLSASLAGVPSTVAEEALPQQSATV